MAAMQHQQPDVIVPYVQLMLHTDFREDRPKRLGFIAQKTAEIQNFKDFSKWPPIWPPCEIGNVTGPLHSADWIDGRW